MYDCGSIVWGSFVLRGLSVRYAAPVGRHRTMDPRCTKHSTPVPPVHTSRPSTAAPWSSSCSLSRKFAEIVFPSHFQDRPTTAEGWCSTAQGTKAISLFSSYGAALGMAVGGPNPWASFADVEDAADATHWSEFTPSRALCSTLKHSATRSRERKMVP